MPVYSRFAETSIDFRLNFLPEIPFKFSLMTKPYQNLGEEKLLPRTKKVNKRIAISLILVRSNVISAKYFAFGFYTKCIKGSLKNIHWRYFLIEKKFSFLGKKVFTNSFKLFDLQCQNRNIGFAM